MHINIGYLDGSSPGLSTSPNRGGVANNMPFFCLESKVSIIKVAA
jgi:hypothetical protein